MNAVRPRAEVWLRPFVRHPWIVMLCMALMLIGGLIVLPQRTGRGWLPRDPLAVDALPDISENQQIIITPWSGRSPQDVEDQITYPLTTSLLGMGGVKTIRSRSMIGLSTLYVIFDDDVDFYWARARILEKLSSLPNNLLPAEAVPSIGPESTGLGQIFWYAIEAVDEEGRPTGGWDLDELRTIQDYTVRYALSAVPGVSEVASVGGFEREFHVHLKPTRLAAYGVTPAMVLRAIRQSHAELSGRTLEFNRVEYVVRGQAPLEELGQIESAVIKSSEYESITVADVADVSIGPAPRRGILDKGGTEAVGGVVAMQHGANPVEVLRSLKQRIAGLQESLPKKIMDDGSLSRIAITPFYDRSRLIDESLGSLTQTITSELLITMLVAMALALSFRTGLLVALLLPTAVLLTLVLMKLLGLQANILALSGIAIAIGTMVDMGVIVAENILRRYSQDKNVAAENIVLNATGEVAGVIAVAVFTTVVSFLPIFALQASEGKLFHPLAWTKTLAILAALVVAIVAIPSMAVLVFRTRRARLQTSGRPSNLGTTIKFILVLLLIIGLSQVWSPLGMGSGRMQNAVIVLPLVLGILGLFMMIRRVYEPILTWCLQNRTIVVLGCLIFVTAGARIWQGTRSEFMPTLDEGAFLLMPSTTPHAGKSEVHDALMIQDRALAAIPEIESAVGKAGRADTALDPAPMSMIETLIRYHPEFLTTREGRVPRFAFDASEEDLFRDVQGQPVKAPDGEPYRVLGKFLRDDDGRLIPDVFGRPFRLWRPPLDPIRNKGRNAWQGIQSVDDIWQVVDRATRVPGLTVAPRLQPIETRLIMLQTGLRAPFGVRIQAKSLLALEQAAVPVEQALRTHPMVRAETVVAERSNAKPYLEVNVDRENLRRYGLSARDVLTNMSLAVAGEPTFSVSTGRDRTAIRVRYPRELREDPDAIGEVLVDTHNGRQVRLRHVSSIDFVPGAQVIRSEDGFLTSYVMFDKQDAFDSIDVARSVEEQLRSARRNGELKLPADTQLTVAGTYQNEVRANRRLLIIVPVSLVIIFLLLYALFKSSMTALIVFSGVLIAWSGGFMMIWLFGQPWFLNIDVAGIDLRELFQVEPVKLSVAVWVGFLALFGTSTDDGVVLAAYVRQVRREEGGRASSTSAELIMEACRRRIRPCLMTSATTIIALLPILTATGRGSDVLRPMAIPVFGGMVAALLSTLVVPVLLSFLPPASPTGNGEAHQDD